MTLFTGKYWALIDTLAVPMKRFEHPKLEFLSREEMLALIGAPGTSWISRRDHLLLGLLYNTGARVSEIINVKVADIVLDGAACVHWHGKGRKHRAVPFWKSTSQEIRAWLQMNPQMGDDSALLPNRDGQVMTRNNVAQRVSLAATPRPPKRTPVCPGVTFLRTAFDTHPRCTCAIRS